MKLAFPDDVGVEPSGVSYYYSSQRDKNYWGSNSNTVLSLPIQKVSDFDLEEKWIPKQGELVRAWDDGDVGDKFIFITKLLNSKYPNLCVASGEKSMYHQGKEFKTTQYQNISQIPKKKTITMQQIADKFGYEVDEIEIL